MTLKGAGSVAVVVVAQLAHRANIPTIPRLARIHLDSKPMVTTVVAFYVDQIATVEGEDRTVV